MRSGATPRSSREPGVARAGADDTRDPSPPLSAPDPETEVVIPITGELDLHAFAPRDISALVADYVEACREAGVRELRLVHGRGIGVQRALVRRVLASLPGIVDVRDAPPGSGGWGATLARLVDAPPASREKTQGNSCEKNCGSARPRQSRAR